ncbi:6778_t:CDS:2 [Ambispora leptoticha]|uniref:6778_t:CDS:1 n=1 Tax=Ambispora leptoticha TaxID=144679 RepID=A0A9N9FH46_9GLOM|nr:6778_t:CDS:2 [Ambispora leptoticha]
MASESQTAHALNIIIINGFIVATSVDSLREKRGMALKQTLYIGKSKLM